MRKPGQGLRSAPYAAALCLVFVQGCAFGPSVLEKSHGRYDDALRQVDEEELLRNLVHLRYVESPIEINVSSIAAQYELGGTAEARPFFVAPNSSNGIFKAYTSILPDALVSGANRPTFTLTPADNSQSVRQFLAPIPAETLVFFMESSWPVATVLRLWVERLNGVPNAVTASNAQHDTISDFARFLRVVELLQAAQERELAFVYSRQHNVEVSGPLPADSITAPAAVEAAKSNMEYRPRGDGKTWSLLRHERGLVLEVTQNGLGSPEIEELTALLNLLPGQRHYDLLSTGAIPDPLKNPGPPSADLRVQLRSMFQVYCYLANGVEVPPEHLNCGLARAHATGEELTRGLFAVHVCKGHHPPPTAYVAVNYRGYWYYIDDRDELTKATFLLVLQDSRLDFANPQPGSAPFLTLPVGR